MPFHVYVVEQPTLLDDLLEDSDRLFHHRSAIIQQAFHEQWLKSLGEAIGQEQIEHADDKPALVELRARQRLQGCWRALHREQRVMIENEVIARGERNQAIKDYVASLSEGVESVAG